MKSVYQERGESTTTAHEIRNADGSLIATHHRKETGEGKQMWWSSPGNPKGLGGMKLDQLPLYGAELVSDLSPDELVVLVEGESPREALEAAGIPTVGTVTGSSATPGPEALKVLRGRRVCLWPDGDDPGQKHMERVGAELQGVAAEVLMYRWYDAPDHITGPDAADHPAVKSRDRKAIDRLLTDLEGAPRYIGGKQESKGLPGRVDLGEILENGIEPVPQLIEGLLYEGRIHSLAGEPGSGKTFISLWSCLEVMKQGQPVLYLDAENGPRLITERLRDMGATRKDLELFAYYNAEVALDDNEGVAMLQATLEEQEPALVVLDSFADLLSISGLEENSNDDCTLWMRRVAQGIKDAGSTVLILDHVPKGGRGPRGGGSKKAKVDVQWDLGVEQPFDRERTGEIELKNDKDRECWLPKIVRFSVGGGVFAMSAGTIETPDPQTNMTEAAGKAYDCIKRKGKEGARWSDLESAVGSKGSTNRALTELGRWNLFEKRNRKYYAIEVEPENPVDTPDFQGSTMFHECSTEQNGTDESGGVPGVPHPLGVEPVEPNVPTDDVEDLREMFGEDR